MTQEQVESQLSAMFDGELPAAECELLSRRIDRDENLRARWSRYALIGAAMRSEPVATAPRGFAGRVSAALDVSDREGQRRARSMGQAGGKARVRAVGRKRTLWNTALAASMVAAVAGVSISMLRYSSSPLSVSATASNVSAASILHAASVARGGLPTAPAMTLMPVAAHVASDRSAGEPRSYTTPINQSSSGIGLRTELADFIVAHSEYSTPLMRRNLLSALVSSEDGADFPAPHSGAADAGQIDAAVTASSVSH